jgi:hypothetical protein
LGLLLPILNLGFPVTKETVQRANNEASLVIVEEFTVLPSEFSRIELFDEVPAPSDEIWLKGTKSGQVFRDESGDWVVQVLRSEITTLDGPRENQDHLQVRIRSDVSGSEHVFLIGLSADLWIKPIGDDFPELPLELEWLDLKDRIGFRLGGLDEAGYLPSFMLVSKSRNEAW